MFKSLSKVFLVLVFALSITTLANSGGKKDIVDTAVSAGSFNTLAAALQAADLVDALKQLGKR